MPIPLPTSDLLGWPLANASFESCVGALEAMMLGEGPNLVFTPNVDHLRIVQEDPSAESAYRQASLLLPDGVPLLWAARWLGRPLISKLAGSDLFEPLIARCAQREIPIFLMGGFSGTAQEALGILERRHGPLCIAGFESPPLGYEKDETYSQGLAERIRRSGARFVIGCTGTPKTEIWLARWQPVIHAPLAVSFGAAIDFTTGRVKRAPRWMQRVGLEWLWRLLLEPRRMYKRYLVRDPGFFLDVLRQWRSERNARQN